MAPSLGVRLLKTAILNIHPARSSKLKRSAKQTETHIKNCLAPELSDENNVVFGMPERLTYAGYCEYLKNSNNFKN
jgi:hypothetical protein